MPLTPERWQQVAAIYEQAVDRDSSERYAFLSQACAGDEELRREVEALLRQEAVHGILDRPVWAIAAPLFSGPNLRTGATLGPYRIDGLLGAGGMGEVFRATDTRLNRQVAIKILPGAVAVDEQMRARFAREARAVASLSHPHICTLHDVGRQDEVDFLVMEYLQGQTLASRLKNGHLTLDEAFSCAIEVAGALDHAHQHGIVHRDLKPGNIMLTPGGAKLLDFGLAKFRSAAGTSEADVTRAETIDGAPAHTRTEVDDGQVTRGGAILGTLRYMAPEQIEGGDADARSDLFSFGALLHEMLTGKCAFDGESAAAVRAAIVGHEPSRVSSLQPSVPPAVDEIVRRCLAKNPDERWQTASDALRELRRVFAATTRERAHQKHPWGWSAAVLVAAIAGGLAWLWMGGFEREPTTTTATRIRSVAVMPLEDLSGDPEQEYFADGMTEQLIAELAKVKGLRTISRMSVMQYRTAPKPLAAIAQELRVDALIEGSVLRSGNTVRITVKLIRADTAEVIWAQSYERATRDVLALQENVARAISSEVGITLTPQEQARLAAARPVDPDVHFQILLGRHHAAKATEEGLRKAVQYFDTAIAKDPMNAMAHAGLADAYTGLNGFYMDPQEAMPKAKRAAETALRLDDSLADAHAALCLLYTSPSPRDS